MQEKLDAHITQILIDLDKLSNEITRINNVIIKHKTSLMEIKKKISESGLESTQSLRHEPVKNGKKILIVDDDPAIRELLKTFLEMEGYESFFAEDGFAGLEMVLKVKPDLIILDVMMPKMDGFEFCDTVYQDPITRDIPIVMLSAKSTEDDIKTGYFVGAKGYLSKPFSQKDLLQLINNLIKQD